MAPTRCVLWNFATNAARANHERNEIRVRLVSDTAFGLFAAITGALMMVGCPQTPTPGPSFRDCSNGCPEMVVVQQGRFTMGAPAGEKCARITRSTSRTFDTAAFGRDPTQARNGQI